MTGSAPPSLVRGIRHLAVTIVSEAKQRGTNLGAMIGETGTSAVSTNTTNGLQPGPRDGYLPDQTPIKY
jgi:hypothetical protein